MSSNNNGSLHRMVSACSLLLAPYSLLLAPGTCVLAPDTRASRAFRVWAMDLEGLVQSAPLPGLAGLANHSIAASSGRHPRCLQSPPTGSQCRPSQVQCAVGPSDCRPRYAQVTMVTARPFCPPRIRPLPPT